MVRIRTTMNPTQELEVTDAVAEDLAFQGVLLQGTRAKTPAGLTDAAVRQVRDSTYTPAMRAGIAEADRRAQASAAQRGHSSKPSGGNAAPPVISDGATVTPTDPQPGEDPTPDEGQEPGVVETEDGTKHVGVLPASAAIPDGRIGQETPEDDEGAPQTPDGGQQPQPSGDTGDQATADVAPDTSGDVPADLKEN